MQGAFIDILRTFSKEDIKGFKKFILSPLYNSNKSVVKFFDFLSKYHPLFKNNLLTKHKIFEKVYGKKEYNRDTYKTLVFKLTKLLEEFLLYSSLNKHPFEKSSMLLRELRLRGLDKYYLKKSVQAEKILDTFSPFEADFFEYKRILETIKTDYILSRKDFYRTTQELTGRGEYVILSFIIKFIYSLEDLHFLYYETGYKPKNNLVEEALEFIDLYGIVKKVEQFKSPYEYAILLKYYELTALRDLDFKSYTRYKNYFYKYSNMISWGDKYNILGTLNSVCILGHRKGEKRFKNKLTHYRKLRQNRHKLQGEPAEGR